MGVPDHVIIIGAGIFGISTAISLATRYPNTKIDVVDRYEPPVPDGTSVDTTRCLRIDYKDPVYYELAYQAMEIIKADPDISPFFHPCGMSFVYDGKKDRWEEIFRTGKISAEKVNEGHPEKMIYTNNNAEVFKLIHGQNYEPKTPEELGRESWWNKGYCNLSNGFIDAAKSMKAYYERAKTFDNICFTFKEVESISYHEGTNEAKGVKFIEGTTLLSDLVVVAAGAWSSKLVDLEGICKSSAIEVAWYKVTPQEEEQWKNMAITTNLSTGINTFPPYEGEIKILRRSAGYKNTVVVANPEPLSETKSVTISYPRTLMTNPSDWIPQDAEHALRENMKEIFPTLADRPFDRTKLCWLTQTPSANFLIDNHPKLKNVLMATGGSAHAWKFVSIIGDKVVDFMAGKLDPELVSKWSWKEKVELSADTGSAPRMIGDSQEVTDTIRNSPFVSS
ncbi:hypothetical protein CANARDRAFT_28365 [[Candida] arabinofermentans NRRL YB-2248]|uniref:FAD dependent oxidoreductase domain-containing protein n=1 Tax=[Candida] arabinofermentans NRRL YB-2248 TaxID=983967 RepID=A0A1E4T1H8_9ASCO|nr:hypothetical protein CANARDRAFT_28365 [[Candida] arabinofermentans NRRL YB-2248]